MCRNITPLRGLMPAATEDEITAAAIQFVRKIAGVTTVTPAIRESFDRAVEDIANATRTLLIEMPARRNPPATLPPLRRINLKQTS